MPDALFIAADGGASTTQVALFDSHGTEIGSAESGPSSLTLKGAAAWQPILNAANRILAAADLDVAALEGAHYGIGLAGANNGMLRRLFQAKAPVAGSVRVTTDAFIAVLGAHGGGPGGIVTVGTGSVSYSIADDGSCWHSGGWGYPIDDKGSGAWIGHEALSLSLQVLDQRITDPPGGLSLFQDLLRTCGQTREEILDWLHVATSTDMASLAPTVIDAAKKDHATAIDILTRAGVEIDRLACALDHTRHIPIAIVGGLAQPLAPYLPAALTAWAKPAQASPLAGALMVARGEAPEERLPDL